MTRRSMMGLVREGKRKVSGSGFLVTWDVDSRDRTTTNRVKYFVFGRSVRTDGKEYEYRGFVWKEGVRYLAQSACSSVPTDSPRFGGSSPATGSTTRWSRSFLPNGSFT